MIFRALSPFHQTTQSCLTPRPLDSVTVQPVSSFAETSPSSFGTAARIFTGDTFLPLAQQSIGGIRRLLLRCTLERTPRHNDYHSGIEFTSALAVYQRLSRASVTHSETGFFVPRFKIHFVRKFDSARVSFKRQPLCLQTLACKSPILRRPCVLAVQKSELSGNVLGHRPSVSFYGA